MNRGGALGGMRRPGTAGFPAAEGGGGGGGALPVSKLGASVWYLAGWNGATDPQLADGLPAAWLETVWLLPELMTVSGRLHLKYFTAGGFGSNQHKDLLYSNTEDDLLPLAKIFESYVADPEVNTWLEVNTGIDVEAGEVIWFGALLPANRSNGFGHWDNTSAARRHLGFDLPDAGTPDFNPGGDPIANYVGYKFASAWANGAVDPGALATAPPALTKWRAGVASNKSPALWYRIA